MCMIRNGIISSPPNLMIHLNVQIEFDPGIVGVF